jgi:hypothetical protein
METTITFVLGLLSGTVPLGIAYAIWNALRVNKNISNIKKDLQEIKETAWNRQQDTDGRFAFRDRAAKEERQELERTLDDMRRNLYETIHSVENNGWKAAEEVHRRIDELISRLDKATTDTEAYTDSEVRNVLNLLDDTRSDINDEYESIKRYIDRRIDKTVDVLCERMDNLNNKSPFTYGSTTPYASGGSVTVTGSDNSTTYTKEAPDRIYS